MHGSPNLLTGAILNQLNYKIGDADERWNPIKPLQGLGKGGFPYRCTFQGFFRFKLLEVQLIQQFTASLLPFLKYPSINFAVVSLCRQEKAVQVPEHNRNRQHNNAQKEFVRTLNFFGEQRQNHRKQCNCPPLDLKRVLRHSVDTALDKVNFLMPAL